MKNNIHLLVSYFAVFAILTSCQTSSEFNSSALVKKRKYTKGYHLNLASAKYNKPASTLEEPAYEKAEARKIVHTEIAGAEVEAQPAPHFEGLTASTNPGIESPNDRSTDLEQSNASSSAAMVQDALVTKRDRFSPSSTFTAYHSERGKKVSTATPMQSIDSGFSVLLFVILAILLPPLAVGLLYGISGPFWLSLILSLLLWVPGVIYALIKVFQKA